MQLLLETAERYQNTILRSQLYAEMSLAKNKERWVQDLRDMLAMSFGFIAALKWVLGIGLTDYEKARLLVEIEDMIDAQSD